MMPVAEGANISQTVSMISNATPQWTSRGPGNRLLQATVANLLTTVKEQAAQIQKVSGQLELSKAAPQTVLNNQ
jgi:hypothetical protein